MNPDQTSDGSMWDRRFAEPDYAYGTEANVWLQSIVETLAPEPNPEALFPADGEGRNAVWAATEGWKATVFDLSKEGERKCRLLAEGHGVQVNYEVDDLVLRTFPDERYALIACSWFHTPPPIRKKHMPRMLHALAPGGHFVMEGYHKTQLNFSSGGPKSFDLLFDLDEVVEELTGPTAPPMSVLYAAVEETVLDESDLHRGPASVVRIHLVRDETG
jgi:hypothetical protein